MPIYEYRCLECAQVFEEWQKDFTERQVACPVCSGKSERLISNSSFVLKGGGWYTDQYSKPATASEPRKKSGCACASPGETAPAPKAETAPACAGTCAGGGLAH